MGRPKGSKNKPKPTANLDGGEWFQRNVIKSDIKGMPELEQIEIPAKKDSLSLEDLRKKCRENGIAYMVELFPANRIQNSEIAMKWKECFNKLKELKELIYN